MKKSRDGKSHSWWWDSHISPKNSRWLEENLEGMHSGFAWEFWLICAITAAFSIFSVFLSVCQVHVN
jgi:hypothetical protein